MTGTVARQVRPRAEARPRDPPDGRRWPAVVGPPRSRLLGRAAFGRRRGPDGRQAGESRNWRGLPGCGRRRCPAAERGHPPPAPHTRSPRDSEVAAGGGPPGFVAFKGVGGRCRQTGPAKSVQSPRYGELLAFFFFFARGVWKVHPCYKHRVPKEGGEGKGPSHLLPPGNYPRLSGLPL